MKQVLLDRFLTGHPEDVVWDQRSIDKRLSRSHIVPGMNEETFVRRYQMLAFNARFAANDDGSFASAFLAQNIDGTIDFGQDRRFLRLSGLENLRYPRQPSRDIANARSLTGRFRQA